MKRHGFIIISAIITFTLVVVYMIHFHNAPLSDNTSDWGAWGNYVSIGISILSVSLIYATYKEQQYSNRLSRFEEHYHVSLKTLIELFEKRKGSVNSIFTKVAAHFRNSFDPLIDYEQLKTQGILGYYYSSAAVDGQEECDEIFRYLHSTLLHIQNQEMLSDKEKELPLTEISCLLPENGRILFLCWGCSIGIDVTGFYKWGLFRTDNINNIALDNIVTFACTGKRPKVQSEINAENIVLEDDSEEQFSETYDRLYNNKTKQQ